MRILEKATGRSRPWWVTALGLVLVPVLVAAGLLAATWNAGSRLHRVEAAVVNLDKAVSVNGQIVPLGRQLSAALVDSERDQNFTWVLADAGHAESGLRSGRYAAVVTIPAGFSAAATSFGGSPDDARQATIDVRTSPTAGLADSALGQSVAQAAAQALNRTLTQTYLENVYLGFGEMGTQFRTVADAASQLADGNEKLADGLARASSGAGELSGGVDRMAASTGAVRSGGSQLVSGLDQLSDGLGQSATGSRQLADGLGALSAGSPSLRAGARSLATGAADLSAGIATYRDTGLVPYTAGTTQLATSSAAQLDMLISLLTLLEQLQAASGSNSDLSQYVPQVRQAIGALQQQLASVETTPQQLAQQLAGTQTAINAGLDKVAQAATVCPPQIEQLGDGACQGYLAGAQMAVSQGKLAVQKAFTTPDPATGRTLQQSLQQLASSLAAMGTSDLADILTQTTVVLGQLDDLLAGIGSAGIPTAAELRAQKAQLLQLAAAGPALVSGATALSDGAAQLGAGITTYADGVDQYTGGVDAIATGTGQLADGLAQAADGASQAADGARQYVDGVGLLLDGIDQLAPGAAQLADGLAQSADGSAQLADGTRRLADGLAEGATTIPSYTKEQSANLATVVASPISVTALDDLVPPAATWASLLMVLALWFGAMASYLVLPALRRRLALSNKPTWRLAAESVGPAAAVMIAQVLAVGVIAEFVLRLPAGRFAMLLAFLGVAGLAFVGVNHALVAWGKGVGRLVAVAFAVITIAGAATHALPGLFDALRGLSPLSPALDGVRQIATGGTGATGSVFALLGWGAVALLASTVAVLRARTVPAKALLSAT